MEKLFIEAVGFTTRITALLAEEDYSNLQNQLLANPDLGKVMPGCGGLRKLRWSDPRRRKGKRGGCRVIYLHVPDANVIFMVDVYDKDAQADLTPKQKQRLKSLAADFKKQAIEKYG